MKKAQSRGIFMVLLGGAISMTIFALLFVFGLQYAQQSQANVTYNETQYSNFDKTSEIVNLSMEMNEAFQGNNTGGTNVGDIINVVTTGGYNTIKILGAIPGIYGDMIGNLGESLGIPKPIFVLIGTIILFSIIALFILLVFRVYIT